MDFTTSWDDGRADDMRLAVLLEKYGAKGTFYVSPPPTHEKQALTDGEIKDLSQRHEIGAHTITHPKLTRLSLDDARREIAESKTWIEERIGKPCTAFCYPYGDENTAMRTLVKEAGYETARTVEQLQLSSNDPFGMPTTLQIYPFPFRRKFTRWWHVIDPVARLRMFYPTMRQYGLPLSATCSWLNLAKAMFMYGLQTDQSFFHLWGHSWEVEKYGMWGELEKFLEFVSKQDNVTYAVNSQLLSRS
ncbi:MAG: polysaccharide deacetylase family protein [Candidatus Peregrinibacteria bacterium]|nr:polysaccharide deacetylase family protein [Candidatus Peregrinibacteria bacterium]MCB9807986.1 polysaccharide deacetylase family protein [Candidatus Peribacteria bacterium]